MKKYISIILTISCMTGLIWSCSKDTDPAAPTMATDGLAFVKISQFSPNFRQVLNTKDSFNLYINNVKLNAPFLTYGSVYPTASNLYAEVPAGTSTFKISVIGANGLDSLVVKSFDKTLAAGSYYSFMITDSVLTTNEAKQIFVKDNFARTDTTHYTIRFAHTILNDTAGANVDVYSSRLKANLFSNISPGTVTTFASQPYSILTDTITVRRTGTGYVLATLLTVISARERAYSLVYKGTASLTTGAKARSLVYYPNQ